MNVLSIFSVASFRRTNSLLVRVSITRIKAPSR
jgi:hypothetical protein